MEEESFYGLMEINMKENGKTIKNMALENLQANNIHIKVI